MRDKLYLVGDGEAELIAILSVYFSVAPDICGVLSVTQVRYM